MDYLKLKKRNDILKLGFQDEDGNILKDKDGNEVYIEFAIGDIDLPLKYNKCINEMQKAKIRLKNQYTIIDKKQDHKGKQLLSSNEVAKLNALKQFYKDMEEAMDLFLGKGGTQKFLNGRRPYLEMWDDISEALEPHMGKLQLKVNDIEKRIKEKYKVEQVESDVLTNE